MVTDSLAYEVPLVKTCFDTYVCTIFLKYLRTTMSPGAAAGISDEMQNWERFQEFSTVREERMDWFPFSTIMLKGNRV